ncbi:MAG: DUF2179 domain-containing protein [Flavobacterium sp.]|nr:MAG: DUF2179 domain-containing protein [Flavobacterium sp.]
MEQQRTITAAYDEVYQHVMEQLQAHLPSYLTYHTAAHTQHVIEVAEQLALAEGVNEEAMLILKSAALLHDTGFLHTYKKHEEASCIFARNTLPAYGYSTTQIEEICCLIMATKLPQHPKNQLEELLCDADLHYIGTDDYETISHCLFEEFKRKDIVSTKKEWQEKQFRFMTSHRFFTKTAVSRYGGKKAEHIKKLTEHHRKLSVESHLPQDLFFMMIGAFAAGFGLKGFLMPAGFFDGGVTGIALLLNKLTGLKMFLLLPLLNLPFIIFGYFTVSRAFAVKTLFAAILVGLSVLLIPYPSVTEDKLLIAIFGGVFLGIGVGFAMRAGCALDGIEVLALHTFKKTSFTITEIIMAINIVIFGAAAFTAGINVALYAVLTYFVASKTIDYVVEGIQAYTGVTIISKESENIKHQLVNELGRGITIYQGKRGFLPGNFNISTDCEIIFTVVTRLEMRRLKNVVYETDPTAFVFASTIREASGGIINRRAAH